MEAAERLQQARNRLISASLRVAAAERGGLDSRDAEIELEHANAEFDQAVTEMQQAQYQWLADNELEGGPED